jgi:ERCC4-type nuclease
LLVIGRESAARLLEKFGSHKAVIKAGRHELEAVYWIYENIAEGIRSE